MACVFIQFHLLPQSFTVFFWLFKELKVCVNTQFFYMAISWEYEFKPHTVVFKGGIVSCFRQCTMHHHLKAIQTEVACFCFCLLCSGLTILFMILFDVWWIWSVWALLGRYFAFEDCAFLQKRVNIVWKTKYDLNVLPTDLKNTAHHTVDSGIVLWLKVQFRDNENLKFLTGSRIVTSAWPPKFIHISPISFSSPPAPPTCYLEKVKTNSFCK